MLLLDRNNEPTNTVYYLAAVSYARLEEIKQSTASSLYSYLSTNIIKFNVNYEFFIMALDFLFLLDKIDADKEGVLHVSKFAENHE